MQEFRFVNRKKPPVPLFSPMNGSNAPSASQIEMGRDTESSKPIQSPTLSPTLVVESHEERSPAVIAELPLPPWPPEDPNLSERLQRLSMENLPPLPETPEESLSSSFSQTAQSKKRNHNQFSQPAKKNNRFEHSLIEQINRLKLDPTDLKKHKPGDFGL